MKQAQYKQDDFWESVSVSERGERLYRAIHKGFSCEVFNKLADILGICMLILCFNSWKKVVH